MGEVRPRLDLSTIYSIEDDDVNSAGGSSTGAWAAPKQPKMESVRRCGRPCSEAGSSLAPGPARRGGDVRAQVEAGGAEQVHVVGRELALQARPWRVDAGPRVELRPRRVAEEVRHHPEDGRQLRRRRVPSGDCG
ncbi:hypothetical protein Zm00014a_014463 [Zea mays]|uniref:Uncharacterized protein n=2 Tax=Zea mays TaxID=4577 RepID=A0A3L6EV21_MAIZE|nr:hypothetical protein Zm00014a_014463 [Zea mays]